MNGTKVLPAGGGRPVLPPLELSPQFSMSRRWLAVSSPKLAPRSFNHLLSPPSSPDSPLARSPMFGRKKRVVFADAKGLALTTVRYFSEEEEEGEEEEQAPQSPSPAETAPGVAGLPGPGGASQAGENAPQFRPVSRRGRQLRLRLGFPQPSLDFPTFSARLQEELVLLESCKVTPESLSGTVRVRNLGSDKAVHVRVTFDSWRGYRDVPCALQPRSPASAAPSDTDLFAFDIPLPDRLDPRNRLEFCVSFRHGKGTVLWDKNKGQNYRVHVCLESDTPAASLLASHRSSLYLHAKRRGMWDSLQTGTGQRMDQSNGSPGFRSPRQAGADWRAGTPPGSPLNSPRRVPFGDAGLKFTY